MPKLITVNERLLNLSPEFRYSHAGGDAVYAAENQGANGISDERVLKEGDKIDSRNHVIVTAVGTAELLQFAHNEPDLPEPKSTKTKGK